MRIHFVTFFLLAATVTLAQLRPSCNQLSIQFLKEAPVHYQQGQRKALDSLLTRMEQQCGPNELSLRMKTLLAIEDDSFHEYNLDYYNYLGLVDYLDDQRFRMLMDSVYENPYEMYNYYFIEPELVFAYNTFTRELANQIAKERGIDLEGPLCSSTAMILQLYGGHSDRFTATLKDPSCNALLSYFYRAQRRSIERKLIADAAFSVGIWTPFGKASLLGNHTFLGMHIGWGRKKMFYDVAIDLRLGNSPNPYEVIYQDALTSTNHYLGGFVGLNLGYELKKLGHSKLYALGGAGWDWFDCIIGDPKQDLPYKSIGSLNLNTGIGYRIFSRDNAYVGLECRYNFINYKNTGGTDLSGNTMTTRLLIGIFKNDKRTRELAQLKNIFD